MSRIRTSDGTVLSVETVTDGEFLKRVGTTVVSAVPPGADEIADIPGLQDALDAASTWARPFALMGA